MNAHTISWTIYAVFVAIAIAFNGEDAAFISYGPYGWGKYLFWVLFIVFTLYTYHCSTKESLFKTIKVMRNLYWGKQIGIDLYIGLIIFLGLIFLHQPSELNSQ